MEEVLPCQGVNGTARSRPGKKLPLSACGEGERKSLALKEGSCSPWLVAPGISQTHTHTVPQARGLSGFSPPPPALPDPPFHPEAECGRPRPPFPALASHQPRGASKADRERLAQSHLASFLVEPGFEPAL